MGVVIGFNWPVFHDTSVAAIVDGRLVFCSEEERFSRHKHSFGEHPIGAMLAAFRHLKTKFGIDPTDVAHYAVNWDPKLFGRYSGLRSFLAKTAYKFDEELYHGRYAGIFGNQPSGYKNYLTLARSGFLKHVFRRLGTEVPKEAKVFPVEHHLAHAASAYYFSGTGSAAALTVDGEGERAASVVWKVVHGEFEKVAEVDTQKGSIGWLYGHTSEVMGFRPLEGEGKVMGLAPYGKLNVRIWKKMASIVRLLRDSDSPYVFNFGTKVRNPYLRHRKLAADLAEGLNLHWNPHGALNRDSIDLAWSLQNITEEVMMHLASFTKEYSNEHELVLAGGVALNAKASMRIHYSHIFNRMFTFPAANDAGGPVGAAAWVHHHLVGDKMNHVLEDAYLGPEYPAEEIEEIVKKGKWESQFLGTDSAPVAELVAKGGIVAWYQGRAELGPRALGNRSIIADPTKPTTLKIVNEIKGREWWRPLAPSVLEESTSEYFDDPTYTEYMLLMLRVSDQAKAKVPAICHVDGTSRPQCVRPGNNKMWYDMIRSFKSITGEGMVVNTSFNLAGEPLVETPQDALKSFAIGGFDAMYLDGWFIRKNQCPHDT